MDSILLRIRINENYYFEGKAEAFKFFWTVSS